MLHPSSAVQAESAIPPLTVEMAVVFAIAGVMFVMFAMEILPPDITAFIVMVSLIVLGPWTGISPTEGITGFANDATITVLAMLVLSFGVSQTGVVQELGEWMAAFAGTDERKQLAFEETGAADYIGIIVVMGANFLPAIGVLWVFYIITTLVTAVVSNSASVILMIPVAVEAAARIGANPFAFVLAVTFASSADFMTPIGYQTNLLVYGPGGYRFTDYFRVGAPLQLLLSIVTVLGIALFWGL